MKRPRKWEKDIILWAVEYYDESAKQAILNWNEGKFEPGLTLMSMENGYAICKLADDSQCEIPQEVRDQIEEISQKIIDGEIVVECMPTYEEILSTIE